ARRRVTRYCPFAPLRPGLQPEDLRHHIAALRVGEQRAGNYRIGLGDAAIEVITTPLAQGLWRAPDDPGDVVLADADPSQMAHLFAHRVVDDKRLSRHGRPLTAPGPDGRRARRMIHPRPDGSRSAR